MLCVNSVSRDFISESRPADAEARSECPHFLGNLLHTQGISEEQVIGLTTDLFTAGIDSVSDGI